MVETDPAHATRPCLECELPIEDSSAPCPRCGRDDPTSTTLRWEDLVDLAAAFLGKKTRRESGRPPSRPQRGDHFRPLSVVLAFLVLAAASYGVLLMP